MAVNGATDVHSAASVLAIIEEFHTYSLTPGVYYSLMFRLLFSSTAAFLVGQAVKDSFSPILAFASGLAPGGVWGRYGQPSPI